MTLGWLALACAALIGAEPERAPQNDRIRAAVLKADLMFLAGDSFRGRLTGEAENFQAAQFVASRFARLGLKPAGHDSSYFHNYDLVVSRLKSGNRLRVRPQDGAQRDAE